MKIIKNAPIRKVIITPQKVKEIAQQIYNEYEQHTKQIGENDYSRPHLTFILRSEDGTQYEDKEMSMFLENGVLNTRKIVAVEMRYFTQKDDKTLTMQTE
jgi:ribosomal protein L22